MEDNRQLRWTIAIGLSLALHVSIVLLMVGLGGENPLVEVSDKPSMVMPSEIREQAVPKPAETAVKPSVSAEAADRVPEKASQEADSSFKVYVVKAGDNLSKIAKLDGSTLSELAELNGTDVKTLSKLQVGQRIKVKNGVE